MTLPKPAMLLICDDASSGSECSSVEVFDKDLIDNLRFGLRQVGFDCETLHQTGGSSNGLDVSVAMGSSAPALLVLVLAELDADVVQQLSELDNHGACPVIVCAKEHNADLLGEAIQAGVGAYIAGPCSANRAALLAQLAGARFSSRQQLINDAEDAKNKLRERKLVERAKGILMEKKHLSEQDAYRVMRQAAMNRAQPLVQVAASVIQVSELLNA